MQNSFADLVDELQKQLRRKDKAWNAPDAQPDSCWATTFDESSDHSGWVLSSVRYPSPKDATAGTNGTVRTKAYFRKDPFQIQCTRIVRPQGDTYKPPPGLVVSSVERVIWQTSPTGTFLQSREAPRATNIVLNVAKPGPAEYVGFGEQGGRTVMKSATLMNYFCYDNLGYSKVYNQGPLDAREPLYHSQPFFLELNGTPGYHNVTATLVDNYSQVFIDLGQSDSGRIGLGVRFGILDTYILSADKVPQLIWLFTSIVGRPRLKPRFILGHHQGGYGYEKGSQLEGVVTNYRNASIPLDGLHIDVDFQHKYRTFTTDDGNFPNVTGMFAELRKKGVKCCTNITPIISFDGYRTNDDPYATINAAWDRDDHTNPSKNFLIMDKRLLDGLHSQSAQEQQYLRYDGGQAMTVFPNSNDRPVFNSGQDQYLFYENFNSGYPFHGGVSYGDSLGVPGFYPDLNRQVVREQFWALQYEDLFNKGLEFVWQDMTTPAVAYCYGDMLGFPGRLLVSTDPYDQKPDVLPPQTPAIEIWALYSYNLHKATYKALENLPSRKNKRNFIIGRGSSTGMHRFAGLWTGDNRSTWDFWRINVAQVLAVGFGGITIAGVDMGGFMPDGNNGQWCDPDLFIRWYSGSFLLPWYRNHYNGKAGQKLFQEVYKFSTIQQDYPQFSIPDNQRDLYASVLPICKYYVRLRYSLMQALYDRMFENLINGLPIARSMLITDPNDTALMNEAAAFIDNQYLLGHYILVCPIMDPDNVNGGSRQVYLPRPDSWFPFNLRIDEGSSNVGVPLSARVEGGSIFSFNARITSAPAQFPYITPIYVREGKSHHTGCQQEKTLTVPIGAIIPQIGVRNYIGDGVVNPITLHIYPGKNNVSQSSERWTIEMFFDME